MATIEITVLISIIGCFVALAGWLASRDKKISNDSEWKGAVKQQLDDIQSGVSGTKDAIVRLENDMRDHSDRIARLEEIAGRVEVIQEHGERIAAVEQGVKQTHHRINECVEKHFKGERYYE